MKKIIFASLLLIIGVLLPAGVTLGYVYYKHGFNAEKQFVPNNELLIFASLFGILSLVPALILAVLSIVLKIDALKWAFYSSMIAHYLISFYIYFEEGMQREPMGAIFIPIILVAPVSLVGGGLGAIFYLIWKRISASKNNNLV